VSARRRRRSAGATWSGSAAELGGLDVLVNNAAMTHFIDHTDLEALTEEVWDGIFR
jgi:3-oxoacyl-[acyl-carrier protein] reductase